LTKQIENNQKSIAKKSIPA
jgi:hypothetical protein